MRPPEEVSDEDCSARSARAATKAATLDPEDGVRIFVFHYEAKLHLHLLGAANESKDVVRLLWKLLKFRTQSVQRLIERDEFFAVFFQKFAARVESEPAFLRGQQREEQLRALPHRLNRSRHLRRVEFLALQQVLDVTGEFVHPKVADGNAEVVAGNVFQFVRFVEDHRAAVGENAGVGRALGFELDG